MKYALFAGSCFYPEGGADDFQTFGAIEDLKVFYQAYRDESWKSRDATWAHICDESMRIVLQASGDGEEKIVWSEPEQIGRQLMKLAADKGNEAAIREVQDYAVVLTKAGRKKLMEAIRECE